MLTEPVPHNHIAIIGAGFGAIATAVRLQQAGFDDFVLIDRAGDVGGVWRDNSYPGAAVDVKSHLYSLSFAPNPDWHNVFAKQPELHAFLRRVTDQFDLRRRLVLGCEVEELRWNGVEHRWELETAHGQRTAQHVVVATGALAEPVIPDLPGLTAARRARIWHSIEGHSRSILRSPCVGVHHSTTSIVASSLRWICTTSAISAWKRSPAAPR